MNTQIIWAFSWGHEGVSFVLPEPCRAFSAGRTGDLTIPSVDGNIVFEISIDGVIAKCDESVCIGEEALKRICLINREAYTVYNMSGARLFRFSIEQHEMGSQYSYDRSIELSMDQLKVGGTEECHIQIAQYGIPQVAFEIGKSAVGHYVLAKKPFMGVYINSQKLEPGATASLKNGDFIFTSNVSFAYMNDRLLTAHSASVFDLPYTDIAEQNSHLVYPQISRTTRFHEVLPTDSIEIQDPPNLPEQPQRNLLVSLLPALGMIALTIVVRGSMSGSSMILFSVCSMGMGAIASVFTYFETKKRSKVKGEERNKLYREYIDQRREDIRALRDKECQILHRIYIDPEQEIRNVEEFTADLFDRSRTDEDFLDIQLGRGTIESHQRIKCKNHEVFEKTDELYDLPHQLENEFRFIDEMPIVIHGSTANAIGIQGNVESMGLMMNQVVLDLSTRQYPSDVEMYCLCGVDFEPQMYAYRLLPHLQSPCLGRRNLVHDSESRDLILEKLFKEFTIREENKDYAAGAPWMVIFVYADTDLMQHPLMRYIPQASALHALFIFLAQHREQLPQGCSYTVRLFTNVRSGLLVNMYDREADCMFDFRGVSNHEMEAVSQKLAPVYSGETNLSSELVRSLSFYDMPGIDGRITVDAIRSKWESADTRKSLAAPLGVAVGNRPVVLDLTETAHGPHGLVAGTTGSGKSELLISYILSMAYCYSPEDVNFVIIDFKGGGTASQFAGLPHLIGTITNLSDNEMVRSLVSIRAEHRRRQQLFNECGVSNINSYTTEYKAGRVKQPLPHLIIIADEFAELKAQQPDFMDELISTSRIGRSLGIHLILATQKPAGVVNDQIWSNSDFKLCLRVQTREDSNEVLRSPLAAEIREPGRVYLQVGRAGIFQLFQSGYSGVGADQNEKTVKAYRLDKRSLSGRRTCIFEQKPPKSDGKEKKKTQFDVVLKQIIEANNVCEFAKPGMLCLPALPETIRFENTGLAYDLPIGVYDQPSQQRQEVLYYNPLVCNLAVVGASQMGKTNLLQAIVRAAAERMDAHDVVFYIMDFNTGVFRSMAELTVVGGVVTQDQEERFKNLIKLLRQEVAYRKSEIAENNVTSFKVYKENGNDDLPAIIVLLDNFAAYRELYDEDYGSDMTYLFREGPSVGISFVVTATRGNLLGAKNLSSFSQRILLHIADVNNMSEVIEGCRRKIPEVPGRGLSIIDKELLELQVYNAFGEDETIEAFVETHRKGMKARAIPEVPTILTNSIMEKMFGKQFDPLMFAYAMDYTTVEPLVMRLDQQFELTLVGKNEEGKLLFLRSLMAHLLQPDWKDGARIHIIDHYDRGLKEYDTVAEYTTDYTQVRDILKALHATAQERAALVRQEGTTALHDLPLEVVIIYTKEAINAISSDNATMKLFEELKDQYKLMKILLIFGNLENKTVSFSAPALLRQLRESRQAIQFENLSSGRMYDIDGMTVRENRFTLSKDDAFRIDDGLISHIKIVTPENV